jgi:hypothetical protein
MCLIFFKHYGFEAEQEWRLVLARGIRDRIKISFRPDPWYATPYTEVRFQTDSLPLVEIKCGPAPEPQLAKRSVKMLLAEHGYQDVAVNESRIPVRW